CRPLFHLVPSRALGWIRTEVKHLLPAPPPGARLARRGRSAPEPGRVDRERGIALDAASPLAQHLSALAERAARSCPAPAVASGGGEALSRMAVPAKVAAEVSQGIVRPMRSKAGVPDLTSAYRSRPRPPRAQAGWRHDTCVPGARPVTTPLYGRWALRTDRRTRRWTIRMVPPRDHLCNRALGHQPRGSGLRSR